MKELLQHEHAAALSKSKYFIMKKEENNFFRWIKKKCMKTE